MNLKNNKGYVSVDISIAVIVLLILVPTIMGIVFSINHAQNTSDIKTGAVNIAVNTIEASKTIDLSKSDADNQVEILNKLSDDVYKGQIDISTTPAVITTNTAFYKLEVNVTDYKGDNIVKTVKAIVTYKAGNKEESIDLSAVVK